MKPAARQSDKCRPSTTFSPASKRAAPADPKAGGITLTHVSTTLLVCSVATLPPIQVYPSFQPLLPPLSPFGNATLPLWDPSSRREQPTVVECLWEMLQGVLWPLEKNVWHARHGGGGGMQARAGAERWGTAPSLDNWEVSPMSPAALLVCIVVALICTVECSVVARICTSAVAPCTRRPPLKQIQQGSENASAHETTRSEHEGSLPGTSRVVATSDVAKMKRPYLVHGV